MSWPKPCAHERKASARLLRINSLQQLKTKSQTWVRTQFHSIHNEEFTDATQECECRQASHPNAKRSSKLAMLQCWMKEIRTLEIFEMAQRRSVHTGLVDLSRRNMSSFLLAGTVRSPTAFSKLVRPATVCRGETAKIVQCGEKTRCQTMKGMASKATDK